MLIVYLCVALVSHVLHAVAKAVCKGAESACEALADCRATTLALAFGRTDRRTASAERRGSANWENHVHFHQHEEQAEGAHVNEAPSL